MPTRKPSTPGVGLVVERPSMRLHRDHSGEISGELPVPEEVGEENSEAHAIEERDIIREGRDEVERIRKVEKKIDQDRAKFNEFQIEVIDRFGKLEVSVGRLSEVPAMLNELRTDLRIDREARQKEFLMEKEARLKGELQDREADQRLRHVVTTTDIEIGKAEKITKITARAWRRAVRRGRPARQGKARSSSDRRTRRQTRP